MLSNKLKIIWQDLDLLRVPWQLHSASAVTLLRPGALLVLLSWGWAAAPVGWL